MAADDLSDLSRRLENGELDEDLNRFESQYMICAGVKRVFDGTVLIDNTPNSELLIYRIMI